MLFVFDRSEEGILLASIVVETRITQTQYRRFERELMEEIKADDPPRHLILNLDGVEMLSSPAFAAIINVKRFLNVHKKLMILTNLSHRVEEIARIIDFMNIVIITDTLRGAIDYVRENAEI